MKQRISPYQFEDHREFIRQALKASGYSYRSFAAKHGEYVSFTLLSYVLAKGRSGTKNKPLRNFSAETLARIGKILKLNDDEIAYLTLLKLENDAEVLPGPHGSAYVDSLRKLVQDNKSRQFQSTNKQGMAKAHYSQTAQTVAQLLDILPVQFKSRLTKEILEASKVVLSRQRNKAGVKAISSKIVSLGELLALGAP